MDRSKPSSPTRMTSNDICNDIIIEILSWLPVDSLLRFKSVCKSWLSLITNPRFVKLHIHHQNLNPSIMCLASDIHTSMKSMDKVISPSTSSCVILNHEMLQSFNCMQRFVKIIGSCNGLICLYAYDDYDHPYGTSNAFQNDLLFLWNPSIKQLKFLPSHNDGDGDGDIINVSRKLWRYGFGYDHVIDDYKVLASASQDGMRELEAKVYTLGTNSWRRIQGKQPYESDLEYMNDYSTSYRDLRTWTYVNRAFHRIAQLSSLPRYRILSFDSTVGEVFRELPNLECFDTRSAWEAWDLIVSKGCLCLYVHDYSRDDTYMMELWMMKDYGMKESWTKLFRVTIVERLKPLFSCYKNGGTGEVVMKADGTGEVVMEAGGSNQLVIYDPKHANEVKWPKSLSHDPRFEITIYTGSLVSLKS